MQDSCHAHDLPDAWAQRALYFSCHALARLGAVAALRLNDSEAGLAPDELASAAAGCNIIVASRELAVSAAVFQALPDLVAVCRVAVDIREIDVQAASRHGVLVTRASPGFAASVSERVVGVMIGLGRGISRASASHRNWGHATPAMGCELRGASLGIVGYGTIGRYLASLGRALGMKVLVSDPYADIDDLTLERLDLPTLLLARRLRGLPCCGHAGHPQSVRSRRLLHQRFTW
ncbi:NAD(P)-dependent oxidoreductase [Cupriavidus basilensis]